MAHIKAVTQLMMTTSILDDAAVNTWHFQGLNTSVEQADIVAGLTDFFDTLRSYLSGKVAQNGHRIKLYDMADPEPRAPIVDTTFNLSSAPAGGPMASEVCLCLSFQGDRVSGTPQASRRGRIYFGPLDTTPIDSDGRPSSALITDLADAGNTLRLAMIASAGTILWVVYSPTYNTTTPVTNGWVDNAFDTQRRRGLAPSTKTLWP